MPGTYGGRHSSRPKQTLDAVSAMRKLLVAALLLAASADAGLTARLTTTSLSCERVQRIIRQEGGVVMYWQSQRVPGLPRYERLVRDSNFCPPEDYAEPTYVPSADREKCVVKHCQPRINDDGFIFRRR